MRAQSSSATTIYWYSYLPLAVIFVLALILRVHNLNYNSPFNDEAIYVVLGKMGLFLRDWWSYNAQSWVAGLPYIYPSLSALAFSTGGIAGSRLLSVLFGLLTIGEVYLLTEFIFHKAKYAQAAAVIAAFIAAFSAMSLYVSRLATYDSPSFFLLIFGTNHLLRGSSYKNGRYYFLAALGICLAFYTKIITAAFFPVLLTVSYAQVYKNPQAKILWKRYFLIPLILGIIFFFAIDYSGFLIYTGSQVSREHESYSKLLHSLWDYIYPVIILSVPAFIIAVAFKYWKEAIVLTIMAATVPAVHMLNHRWSTLDKHSFLAILFLSPLIGFAISRVLLIPKIFFKIVLSTVLLVGLLYYPVYEYHRLQQYEGHWFNTNSMLSVLYSKAQPEDKILTEAGAATILALYDKIDPQNITTLDYFEYENLKGDTTYLEAVKDGYFNYIELDGQSEVKRDLTNKIRSELDAQYNLMYDSGNFQIYERIY